MKKNGKTYVWVLTLRDVNGDTGEIVLGAFTWVGAAHGHVKRRVGYEIQWTSNDKGVLSYWISDNSDHGFVYRIYPVELNPLVEEVSGHADE